MRYFPQILLLLCMPRVYGVAGSCSETDPRPNTEIACDGQRIDLICPPKSPWIKIEMAKFGREQPESHICARDLTEVKNNTWQPTGDFCPFRDVLDKVSNICRDKKEKCDLKVNFTNPCPNVYNYLVVAYTCLCTRRFSRNRQPSSSTCIPRPQSSDLPTTHFPTQTLTVIGSTMSQNTSSTVYHQPIMFSTTTTPGPSRSHSSRVSPNTTRHVTTVTSKIIPAKSRTAMDLRKKAFLFFLELIIIYYETFDKSPAMAMIWCLVGMLFGFFIITSVFLFYHLRSRNSKDKRLTRISQLDPHEGNAASPTIEMANSEFPHSRQENGSRRCEIRSNQRGGQPTKSRKSNSLENYSSSPTASNGNIFIFTNPLWRGLNEGKTSNAGPAESKSSEEVPETAETTLINCSEPAECNANAAQNESPETAAGHSDSGPRENRKANNNNDDRLIKDGAHKERREKYLQLDTEVTPIIPVGIPSSRVSVDELLARGDQKSTDSVKHGDSENSEERKGSLTKPKARGSIVESQPTNGLLAKFGIETDANYNTILSEPCSILIFSETARSSPYLYNRPSNGEIFHSDSLSRSYEKRTPDDVHACSSPAEKPNDDELSLQTRPSRSLSLDSGYPSATPKFTEPPSYSDATAKLSNSEKQIRAGAEPNGKASSPGTAVQPSCENVPNGGLGRCAATQENDTKIVPRISLQVPGERKHGDHSQSGNGNFEQQPATISRKSPKHRRASSGYYSNNPSPLPDHSVGFGNTQILMNAQKYVPQKKQGNELRLDLKKKQGSSIHPDNNGPPGQTGDDLPPLPPTPLLLPPPSFLPHLHLLASQPRESQEDRKQRSTSGTRKVRFEPKTQRPLKEKVSKKQK